ncbi:MAG: Hsp20/alpha crystallin family protein [Candidatus Portnoybacteria bacterium]
MASFFEKLKKGMNVEDPIEKPAEEPVMEAEEPKEKKEKKQRPKKPKVKKEDKTDFKKIVIEDETPEEITQAPAEEAKEEVKQEKEEPALKPEEDWLGEDEGQLVIDIYQTKDELVIQSAIAGITIEKLNIFLEKDILTIKGIREKPFEEKGDYFFQECFWGPFSREVILPAEVDPDRVSAKIKSGILTIRIPKILREKKRKITVSI